LSGNLSEKRSARRNFGRYAMVVARAPSGTGGIEMNSGLHLADPSVADQRLAQPNLRLQVGSHLIDVGALRVVSRPDLPRITKKAMAVLIELVRHAGATLTRDQLLDAVWKDRVTTPDVLTQAIKELRRAFADDARPSCYIETIPTVGYRLIANVAILPETGAAAGVLPMRGIMSDQDAPVNGGAITYTPATNTSGPSPNAWRILWLVVILVVALLLAAIEFRKGVMLPSAAQVSAWHATNMHAVTSEPGAELSPHLSPDGTRLVYVKFFPETNISRLFMRAPQPSQATLLTSRVDGFEASPTWSPDGSQIAFARLDRDSCRLLLIPSTGGTEREVATCQDYVSNYFDWTPDGKQLITAEPIGGSAGDLTLERIDIASGARQALNYPREPKDQDLEPHYSPDGRWIAFRRGVAPYSDLCVMPAAGGAVHQLTHISTRIRGYTWTADGSALLFSSNLNGEFALYTVSIADGTVAPLGVGPAEYPHLSGASVVYQIPRTKTTLTQLSLGSTETRPLAQSTGSDGPAAFSPDASRVAFVSNRSGSPQLWLYEFASDTATPLTEAQDGLLMYPNWSADGKRILVTLKRADHGNLVEIDLASRRQHVVSNPDEPILYGTYGAEPGSWLLTIGRSSPEDQLVYRRNAGSTGASDTVLAKAVAHAEFDARGRWVYYTKTAERGLFRRQVDGGDEEFVTPLVTSLMIDGWRVVAGKVWYVRDLEYKRTQFHEFDPQTRTEHMVAVFPIELIDRNFSVSANRESIISVPVEKEDTDVGAFTLESSR
jgi:Tol biopolymer transport system component/DNA-binding winged helix-turn-helix (wHTH) protein